MTFKVEGIAKDGTIYKWKEVADEYILAKIQSWEEATEKNKDLKDDKLIYTVIVYK